MRVAVTGATGFIGSALTRALLSRGDHVIALTRDPDKAWSKLPSGVEIVAWNPPSFGSLPGVFSRADAVVNLAGEPVADKRWTSAQKQTILDSRVNATKAVVAAIERANPRPKVLVNQSAIGYYGDRGDETLNEMSPPGSDFLAHVVTEWEATAQPVQALGVRLVVLRTGVVLGDGGGALPRLALPFRVFLGGTMGRPRQWVSWIHIEDEIQLMILALTREEVHGVLNATAPNPVTMEQFSKEIGRALRRPSWIPMLALPLKLALRERGQALLASQRVLPLAADRLAFTFHHPESAAALRSVLTKG